MDEGASTALGVSLSTKRVNTPLVTQHFANCFFEIDNQTD